MERVRSFDVGAGYDPASISPTRAPALETAADGPNPPSAAAIPEKAVSRGHKRSESAMPVIASRPAVAEAVGDKLAELGPGTNPAASPELSGTAVPRVSDGIAGLRSDPEDGNDTGAPHTGGPAPKGPLHRDQTRLFPSLQRLR